MVVLKEQALQYPFAAGDVRKLKAGERVLISGKIFTGRDRLHKYLADGGESPVQLTDGCIFHCGPIAMQEGGRWIVKAAGPTTSSRQNPYMPTIIEKHGVRLIIGKGGMGEETRKACAKHGCVYLQAIGGAGALLAKRIAAVEGVYFLREFGAADALWQLAVERFPAIVAIDTHGKSIYEQVAASSRAALIDALNRRVRLD